MKIGLLAYHSAINFGATLQLLSTYSYLKNHGHEPVVINWVAPDLETSYQAIASTSQRQGHIALRQTIWKETALCHTDEDVADAIRQEGIEAVIIGSDAVCQHHTKRERTVFPCRKIIAVEPATSDRLFPNPFWATWNTLLDRPIPVCLLSASSQDSQYRYFSKSLCRKMTDCIKQYKYASVRDIWTQEMFVHITKGTVIPPVTPDPVFAFNINAASLIPNKEDILHRFSLPERYMLISFINDSIVSQSWLNTFQLLAESEGFCCVKLPFSQSEGFGHLTKEIPLPLSPVDWFALIKYSAGYIGNNMHPIVSAIHNGVPFFSFDNYGLKRLNGLVVSDRSSKIKHILHSAGLSDFRVSCISKTFKAPTPEFVYERVRRFPSNKAKAFADEYYNKYCDMMDRILKSMTTVR